MRNYQREYIAGVTTIVAFQVSVAWSVLGAWPVGVAIWLVAGGPALYYWMRSALRPSAEAREEEAE